MALATLVVAIAAFVLSVIALAYSRYMWRHEGPAVTVRLTGLRQLAEPQPFEGGTGWTTTYPDGSGAGRRTPPPTASHALTVQVTSVGRIAATVGKLEAEVGAETGWDGVIVYLPVGTLSQDLPARLAPTDVLEAEFPLDPDLDRFGGRVRVIAKAQVGREWPESQPVIFEPPTATLGG
jgi:hypothetical protein